MADTPANTRDEWGRRASGSDRPPPAQRDWVTAFAAVGGVFVPLILAIAGYAWHVEGQLSDLSVRSERSSTQIQAMQRQLDDEVRREENHNAAIDAKLDKIGELVGRTVTNLEDLRRELKR